jgi:predicted neuraminidase
MSVCPPVVIQRVDDTIHVHKDGEPAFRPGYRDALDLRTRTGLIMKLLVLAAALAVSSFRAEDPVYEAEQIFAPVETQSHAPGIAECSSGDLIVSWYADAREGDSAVFGARKRHGESHWSEPFVMADRAGFPDGNTAMAIDAKGRLWLFWPTIIGGSWESALTNYRVASDYGRPGTPRWEREGLILLKPADFGAEALRLLGTRELRPPRGAIVGPAGQKAKLTDPLYQRLGWAVRCKPTVLPSGRIILPLYSDTFSISIMALSDDEGSTWYASRPLIGFGNIQPTVLRRNDGTLVAYMRENGSLNRIRVAESKDEALSWSPVSETELPNPGSGLDAVRLASGHWALIYNDSPGSRATLAVSLSDDEGRTWKWTRHLERHAAGRYHYPAIIQAKGGKIHAVYSCFMPQGKPAAGKPRAVELKGIKHVMINEAWIRSGD